MKSNSYSPKPLSLAPLPKEVQRFDFQFIILKFTAQAIGMGKHLRKSVRHCQHIYHLVQAPSYWKKLNENISSNVDYREHVSSTILNTIQHIRRKRNRNCPRCGGIQPELMICTDKGLTFKFTCVEVTDRKNNTIARTDYKVLGEYIKAGFRAMNKKRE